MARLLGMGVADPVETCVSTTRVTIPPISSGVYPYLQMAQLSRGQFWGIFYWLF